MTTWCARSTASISPPRPSSATMEACGPRAPASLRSSLSPSIFPFFNSFMLFFFLIRLDLVVLVIWFSFFFFSEIIFWFFLLIYVVDWSFWLCLFPRKKNFWKMFYTLIRLISDCFFRGSVYLCTSAIHFDEINVIWFAIYNFMYRFWFWIRIFFREIRLSSVWLQRKALDWTRNYWILWFFFSSSVYCIGFR